MLLAISETKILNKLEQVLQVLFYCLHSHIIATTAAAIVCPGNGVLTSFQRSRVYELRIRAMHEANTALLDILVDNSVIICRIGKRCFIS